MSDILIRDVAESTVAEIDRRAGDLGVSRNEYLPLAGHGDADRTAGHG